jgi:hypothetical protein
MFETMFRVPSSMNILDVLVRLYLDEILALFYQGLKLHCDFSLYFVHAQCFKLC